MNNLNNMEFKKTPENITLYNTVRKYADCRQLERFLSANGIIYNKVSCDVESTNCIFKNKLGEQVRFEKGMWIVLDLRSGFYSVSEIDLVTSTLSLIPTDLVQDIHLKILSGEI